MNAGGSVARALGVFVLCVAAVAQAAEQGGGKPKLAVSDFEAQNVDPAEAAALNDAVVSALKDRGLFQVLSTKDVETLVSAERQRQLLGQCKEGEQAEEACALNLGEVIGAPFVLTGSLSRVGSAYQLVLQTLDTQKARLVGRSTRLAADLTTLLLVVPYAAAEATGSPLPPPRSRVVQYSMMAGGSGLVIAGGLVGMLAISREQVLNQELCPPDGVPGADGTCAGRNLRTLAFYEEQNAAIGRDKTLSLALLAGGAALIGAGLWLMPPPEAGPRIALVPSGMGMALVGEWP